MATQTLAGLEFNVQTMEDIDTQLWITTIKNRLDAEVLVSDVKKFKFCKDATITENQQWFSERRNTMMGSNDFTVTLNFSISKIEELAK